MSVRFVRVDADSEQHLAELRRQRILCGWGLEAIPTWQRLIRTGIRDMFWIFPAEGVKEPEEVLEKLNLDRGKIGPPAPDPSFLPLGHVALDWEDYAGEPSLANKDEGVCTIATFFILLSQQGKGLGKVVMREMEKLAVSPELNAKVITLNTVDDDFASTDEYWAKQGLVKDPNYRRNEEWYGKLGYEVYRRAIPRYEMIDTNGEKYLSECVLCGWGADSVPGYINHIRDGVRTMYWIFPPEGEPDGPEVPEKLNLEREKTGPRAPDPRFRPFGHVALDWEDFAGERSLASREDGVCTISTFFILLSQQGKGLGSDSVVMREMERLVVQPPLNAKVMTLHTFDDSFASLPSYWAAQGLPFYPDYRKNPVWYARMGFEVFRQGVPRYPAVREDGTGYLAESVFMRKVLAQPEEAQAEQ
ncbi:hypothetical protein JCM8547_000865 [Rhodosporidiobolus lusitaniae]